MITVVVQTLNQDVKQLCRQEGNEAIFCGLEGKCTLLGDVDEYSYCVFDSDCMKDLIFELQEVREAQELPEAVAHVDEVISFAKRVQGDKSLFLKFTPFDRW